MKTDMERYENHEQLLLGLARGRREDSCAFSRALICPQCGSVFIWHTWCTDVQ